MTEPTEARLKDREAFRLVDAVGLVATTAFAFAAIRAMAFVPTTWTFYTPYSVMSGTDPSFLERCQHGHFVTTAGLALWLAWSIGLLGSGLWRSRREPGRVLSSPGLLACVVTLFVLSWVLIFPFTIEISTPRSAPLELPGFMSGIVVDRFLGYLKGKVGPCVMIAWATLAASRSWRKPSGWLDWVTLAIGIGWIGIWLVKLALG